MARLIYCTLAVHISAEFDAISCLRESASMPWFIANKYDNVQNPRACENGNKK